MYGIINWIICGGVRSFRSEIDAGSVTAPGSRSGGAVRTPKLEQLEMGTYKKGMEYQ